MSAGAAPRGTFELPAVGLGCGNFGEFLDTVASRRVVAAALDAGVTHFDTADVYGDGASETYLGQALAGAGEAVVITTKFGAVPGGDEAAPGSAAAVRRSCEASLARLDRETIDLYLIHHPDPRTPIAETLAVLEELREAGKVRSIGCSNFTAAQLEQAAAAARQLGIRGFEYVQNAYSLLDRTAERDLIPTALTLGVGLIPYMPLAGGMLTGKYRRQGAPDGPARMSRELRGAPVGEYFPALMSDESFAVVEALERFAGDHGHSLLELAFAWLTSSPAVSCVIAGATSPDQLRANVGAIGAWRLTPGEREEVGRLTRADVAFAWHPGMPEYTQPPAGTAVGAPDLRRNVADERSGER